MAEVIKYAIGFDATLYNLLLQENGYKHIDEVVARCIAIKRHIV